MIEEARDLTVAMLKYIGTPFLMENMLSSEKMLKGCSSFLP
jgi:hypothetical protein